MKNTHGGVLLLVKLQVFRSIIQTYKQLSNQIKTRALHRVIHWQKNKVMYRNMSETTSETIFVQLNSGLDRYVLQLFLVTDTLLDFECIKK